MKAGLIDDGVVNKTASLQVSACIGHNAQGSGQPTPDRSAFSKKLSAPTQLQISQHVNMKVSKFLATCVPPKLREKFHQLFSACQYFH